MKTIHKTESDWLDARRQTIGASEVATIIGANKYDSAFALFHRKKSGEHWDGNIATKVGHALEPLIADLYQRETGEQVYDPGPYTVYTSEETPILACTPDRLIGDPIQKCVELKTIGEHAARQDHEPPVGYQVQVQAQMYVLGIDSGDLAVLVGNRKFEIMPLDRHDRIIKMIVEKCKEFFDRLQNDDPPPVDGHPATTQTLKLLHPDDNGETCLITEDFAKLIRGYEAVKEHIKTMEELKQAHYNKLIAAMGDYTFAVGDEKKLSYKTQERKGYLTVPLECETALQELGVKYKKTEQSKFRVLR